MRRTSACFFFVFGAFARLGFTVPLDALLQQYSHIIESDKRQVIIGNIAPAGIIPRCLGDA